MVGEEHRWLEGGEEFGEGKEERREHGYTYKTSILSLSKIKTTHSSWHRLVRPGCGDDVQIYVVGCHLLLDGLGPRFQ